jgi:translocator protein
MNYRAGSINQHAKTSVQRGAQSSLKENSRVIGQAKNSKLDKEHIQRMIELWEAENNESFSGESTETAENGLQEIAEDHNTPDNHDTIEDERYYQRLLELEIKARRNAQKASALNSTLPFDYSKRALQERSRNIQDEERLVKKQEVAVDEEAGGNLGINPRYISLAIWILGLQAVGGIIGVIIAPQINDWYKNLNLPPLNPPNWVFPIAWTILYTLLGISGWILQYTPSFPGLSTIKRLNWLQLFLNESWCLLFFSLHTTGISLVVQLVMDVAVMLIIWMSYKKVRLVALLMLPYLLWLCFATYLNYYVWLNNDSGMTLNAAVSGESGMRYTHHTEQTWTSPNGDYHKKMEEYSKML